MPYFYHNEPTNTYKYYYIETELNLPMASMTFGSPMGCLGFVLSELKNKAESDVIDDDSLRVLGTD